MSWTASGRICARSEYRQGQRRISLLFSQSAAGPGCCGTPVMPCGGRSRRSHKVLKSGCRAEEARLRTAERLVKLIAVFCILSWRVFWMTMLNRSTPNANPSLALTRIETTLLDRLVPDHNDHQLRRKNTLSNYLIKIARLGGYLARASDPPPGNTVMWRGLSQPPTSDWARRRTQQLVGN